METTATEPLSQALPTDSRILDQEIERLLERKKDLTRLLASASDGMQIQRLNREKSRINLSIQQLRVQRNKTNDAINGHIADIVKKGLGYESGVYRRILKEATRRANGEEPEEVSIYPDSYLDDLAQIKLLRDGKMSAEAKVHRIRKVLEESKLSMSGTLAGSEFDRRKKFNVLIDKLLHQLANA